VSDRAALITADDLAALNRAELRRTAGLARHASTGLFAVAALGAAAWAWTMVHQQIQLGSSFGGFGGGDPQVSFTDRVDVFAGNVLQLVLAGALVAAAIVVRLLGDHLFDRHGGSLCGYEIGEPLDPADSTDGWDDADTFEALDPLDP
jgi:hypothetical protein